MFIREKPMSAPTIEESLCIIDLNQYLGNQGINFTVIEYRKKAEEEWRRIVYGFGDTEVTDLERFCLRYKDYEARAIGGGLMQADLKTMRVYIWGENSLYGLEPERADTLKRIRETYEWGPNVFKYVEGEPP